jgi:hypothetical protein
MEYTGLPRNCQFRSQLHKRSRFFLLEMQTSTKSEKLQFRNNSHNVQNYLSRILISYYSTGTSCLQKRKTTNCETQRLKNLHMYWIQTQLHNKRSYWKLQYTIHAMETWQHTCRTLTDLPYIVAKNTIQVICTTTTKVPNNGFLIPSIGFWQWWTTFGLVDVLDFSHYVYQYVTHYLLGTSLVPVFGLLLPKLSLHDDDDLHCKWTQIEVKSVNTTYLKNSVCLHEFH